MRPAHSAIASLVAVALVGTAAPPALAQPALSYFAPGNILPNAGLGVQGRKVWFPDWTFPMRVGAATGQHAYIGTQLTQYHGVDWVNDPRLFAYPHRDNQCEPRSWTMQPCPAGKGHQGVDIRANDNRNNFWPVVAVEAGVVTSVTASTTVQVRSGNHTVRYLHMDRASIAAAGIAPGVNVARGQELGKVSCILSGSCQTSRHLHFDAYTGAAGAGSFYHVYPSLMAAYRRAWGLSDGIANGELALDANHEVGVGPTPEPQEPSESCDNVALAAPLAGVDLNRFSSLWRHNCSIVGLVANASSSGRSFVYYRPKSTLGDLILSDLTLFEGANVGGRFTGIAKHYSRLCGVQRFSVEGEAFEENGVPAVRVTGSRQRLDENCQSTGANTEVLRFNFVERVIPSIAGSEHVIPEPRATLSELTRNFLAITFYPGADGQTRLLPYFSDFPGYSNEGGRIDSGGGLIPALSTDEGGVAISWVWMRKRALFTQGVLVTPRSVAHSMAGVDPSACDAQVNPSAAGLAAAGNDMDAANRICGRVSAYLAGYIGFSGGRGFARDYFGRPVGIDETLNLADTGTAYNWMRTMYSHESGRAPVIAREGFERGVHLGDDYIATYYDNAPADRLRPIAFYADPCNFNQPSCQTAFRSGGEMALVYDRGGMAFSAGLGQIAVEIEALNSRIGALEASIESLSQRVEE